MNKRRIKDIAKISTGQTPPRELLDCFSDNSCDASNTMWIKPEDMHTSKEINITREYLTPKGLNYVKSYPKESVIFNGIGAGIGNVALSNKRFTTNQQNHVLYKCKHYKYLYYYLLCHKETIAQLSSGNVVPILNGSKLKNFIVLDANNFYLDKIVSFLDCQCAKIDTEISLLEKKSKLLEEYKQSLIFETVTKGLDKNAKMKDSGVEWIGEIPQKSKIVKFKNLYSKTNSGEVISKEYWSDNGLNLYSCSKEVLKTSFSNFPQNKLTKNNDLLITRNATPYIFIPESNSLYTNVVQRITLKKHLAIKYIYYVLSVSSKYILSYGDIIASLNMSMWNDISVVLHSKEEQILIAQFLDQQTSKIDQNINLINKKIELLKEYKQSLIHEAVTGQLEI